MFIMLHEIIHVGDLTYNNVQDEGGDFALQAKYGEQPVHEEGYEVGVHFEYAAFGFFMEKMNFKEVQNQFNSGLIMKESNYVNSVIKELCCRWYASNWHTKI